MRSSKQFYGLKYALSVDKMHDAGFKSCADCNAGEMVSRISYVEDRRSTESINFINVAKVCFQREHAISELADDIAATDS